MTDHRFIIEMGTGNDQYGQDYTKAARRAIEDALLHSSIPMFEALNPTLGLSAEDMRIQVTVAVQKPDLVDTNALLKVLPHGKVNVLALTGGMNVENPESGKIIVIATAAVEAFLPYLGDRA